MNKLKIFTLLFLGLNKCFGQDTLKYHRINSPYISEEYFFYRDTLGSSTGKFEKHMFTDDGQVLNGRGRFTETKRKIFLRPFTFIRTAAWVTPSGKPFNGIPNDTILVPNQILFKRTNKSVVDREGKVIYAPISHH